ncbi:hypothetical protein ACE6H2_028571 [Prunus campanulata]
MIRLTSSAKSIGSHLSAASATSLRHLLCHTASVTQRENGYDLSFVHSEEGREFQQTTWTLQTDRRRWFTPSGWVKTT